MRKNLAFIVSGFALCCVIVRLVAAEGPTKPTSPDAGRLDVGGSFGHDHGSLISQKDGPDGKKILHGMQVRIGPNNVLEEYSVFNDGVFEQRTQFFRSGKFFRMQRREHDGSGSDVIYTADSNQVVAQSVKVDGGVDIGPIKVQATIAQGFVKDDKMWNGTFLVREPIPNGYGLRIRLHEYRDGKLVKNDPFPIELLNLPKDKTDEENWPWAFPEWPQRPSSK